MKYDWKNMTEEQKAQAARCEANLPTHMGTTKEELVDIIRWQQAQIEEIRSWCSEYICGENEDEDEGIKSMQNSILGILNRPPKDGDAT